MVPWAGTPSNPENGELILQINNPTSSGLHDGGAGGVGVDSGGLSGETLESAGLAGTTEKSALAGSEEYLSGGSSGSSEHDAEQGGESLAN